MKTSEIRNYMKDFCGVLNRTNKQICFQFEEDETAMQIVEYIGTVNAGNVCAVSKGKRNIYRVNVSEDIKCLNTYLFDFIEDLRDYAETPLRERGGKRWRIRLGDCGVVYNYLNYYPCSGKHERPDEIEAKGYQTKFTRQEIADYLKTDDEAFVDNFIKRFGEEVSE